MIKRPAQHTALTFLRLSKLSVAFLLVMVLLYPILLLFGIGVKVGIVLGLHFLFEALTGSWVILSIFAIITFAFLVVSFFSRVKELGRYYEGLHKTRLSTGQRVWYKAVFAIDFLVTDMLTLCASFLLAYVYWVSASMRSFDPFLTFLQPFLALSIMGGLLQILFSSYYLTHDKLHSVYIHAVHAGKTYSTFTDPVYTAESTTAKKPTKRVRKKSTRKKASKKKSTRKKASKKSSSKKSSRRKTTKRKSTRRKTTKKKSSRRR